MKSSLALACTLLLAPATARADGARYLIITTSGFEEHLQPLADWKTRKGMLARIVTTQQTGYSSRQIQDYVREAAETWDPAPEFVLIAADQGSIAMALEDGYNTDTSFGNIDDDLFVEIIPGRFPATDVTQLQTMVEKTLGYERFPVLDDERYYRSAVMLIYEDYDDDDICSYWGDATWASALMQTAGYTSVDIWSAATTPNIHDRFQDLLEAGVGWASHHGVVGSNCEWPGYGVDPEDLSNGPMLPILVGFTCQTLGYSGYDCYGERWLQAGTPAYPTGGVAYVGQAASCSYCAHWRSAMRRGFWGYIFEDTDTTDIVTFGEAVEAARLRYYEEFRSSSQYYAGTAMGDPELNLWTDVPQAFEVSHPPVLPRGEIEFSVLVSQDGVPREGVRVCAMSDEGSYAVETSGPDGLVSFAVDTSADSKLYLTATGRNLYPFEAELEVYEQGSTEDTDEPSPDDTGEPDIPDDTDRPPTGVAPGGQCGCAAPGLPTLPLALLLLPLLRRRRRGGSCA
jgi:uncharacterized protein (TIGR03382 family)